MLLFHCLRSVLLFSLQSVDLGSIVQSYKGFKMAETDLMLGVQ